MQPYPFSFSGASNYHLAVNDFNLIYMMPGDLILTSGIAVSDLIKLMRLVY